jgi:hypothetical protein
MRNLRRPQRVGIDLAASSCSLIDQHVFGHDGTDAEFDGRRQTNLLGRAVAEVLVLEFGADVDRRALADGSGDGVRYYLAGDCEPRSLMPACSQAASTRWG